MQLTADCQVRRCAPPSVMWSSTCFTRSSHSPFHSWPLPVDPDATTAQDPKVSRNHLPTTGNIRPGSVDREAAGGGPPTPAGAESHRSRLLGEGESWACGTVPTGRDRGRRGGAGAVGLRRVAVGQQPQASRPMIPQPLSPIKGGQRYRHRKPWSCINSSGKDGIRI
jgi:hypothetical protein